MKKTFVLALFALLLIFAVAVFPAQAAPSEDNACWGQATAVFAQTGQMGEHASQQPTPRLGLANLARALYDAGVIPDDSLQSLGAFVANELGLTVEACL
jgi:hypothetical protein